MSAENYSILLNNLNESNIELSENDDDDDDNNVSVHSVVIDSTSDDSSSEEENITSAAERGRGRGRPCGRARGRGRGRVRSRGSRISNANTNSNFSWREIDFNPEKFHLSQPSYVPADTELWTSAQFFNQYIDDDILKVMVDATNRTHFKIKGCSINLSLSELKKWIGISYLMSCIQMPQIKMYFSREWGLDIIKKTMTRDRYFAIRQSLKIVI